MKNYKILMCSSPGGDRGPASGYGRHLDALGQSRFFEIDEINEKVMYDDTTLGTYDVYWFYVRFDPRLFVYLQQKFSKKVFWVGPNVLFEKAEVGPSDEWESAFVSQALCTIYSNVADYYLQRVSQFYRGATLMREIPYCIDKSHFRNDSPVSLSSREIDVLVYSKKRRIDKQFDRLLPLYLKMLSEANLNYRVIEYGSYSREVFMDLLSNSKCCAWVSIEDYCANAQLEAQLAGCPIVGTKYNLTHTFDESYWVDAQLLSPTQWLSWKEEMPAIYLAGTMKILSNLEKIDGAPREYVESSHSYSEYSNRIYSILQELENV